VEQLNLGREKADAAVRDRNDNNDDNTPSVEQQHSVSAAATATFF